jgi:hypothetical protein
MTALESFETSGKTRVTSLPPKSVTLTVPAEQYRFSHHVMALHTTLDIRRTFYRVQSGDIVPFVCVYPTANS